MVAYCDQLVAAGYGLGWIENVVKDVMTLILQQVAHGKCTRNRSKVASSMSRRAKRLSNKQSWFKDRKRSEDSHIDHTSSNIGNKCDKKLGGNVYEAVIFVPLTKGGAASMVVSKDPWSNKGCGREKCIPCKTKAGRCLTQGVVYKLTCTECKDKGMVTEYYGESAGTCYDRGCDHEDMVKRKVATYPIVGHYMEDHPGVGNMPYQMTVIKFERKKLSRQAREGQVITEAKADKVLNGRGDWGQNLPSPKSMND